MDEGRRGSRRQILKYTGEEGESPNRYGKITAVGARGK